MSRTQARAVARSSPSRRGRQVMASASALRAAGRVAVAGLALSARRAGAGRAGVATPQGVEDDDRGAPAAASAAEVRGGQRAQRLAVERQLLHGRLHLL